MTFGDIYHPPKDGASFLLHVSPGGEVAMFRVGPDGKFADMKTGGAAECLLTAVRTKYPYAEVALNESDRVGPRTNYKFKSWKIFCAAFNFNQATKTKVIAEYIWYSTRRADGLCALDNSGLLVPTERGKAADATEVEAADEP